MSHQREMNKLVREAKQRGWTVDHTHGGHWRFLREGAPPLYSSGTPQDGRTIANTLAMLRRHEKGSTDMKIETRKERERQASWDKEHARRRTEVLELLRPFLAEGVVINYDPKAEGVLILRRSVDGRSVTFTADGDAYANLCITEGNGP